MSDVDELIEIWLRTRTASEKDLALKQLIRDCILAEIVGISDDGDVYWYHTGEEL